jgi:uncharacterized protein
VQVLNRSKFDRWRTQEERADFVRMYLSLVRTYPETVTVADCRDEKDDKFLSIALSAGAEMIVSSDDDLLTMNPYRNIKILTAEAFLYNNSNI